VGNGTVAHKEQLLHFPHFFFKIDFFSLMYFSNDEMISIWMSLRKAYDMNVLMNIDHCISKYNCYDE